MDGWGRAVFSTTGAVTGEARWAGWSTGATLNARQRGRGRRWAGGAAGQCGWDERWRPGLAGESSIALAFQTAGETLVRCRGSHDMAGARGHGRGAGGVRVPRRIRAVRRAGHRASPRAHARVGCACVCWLVGWCHGARSRRHAPPASRGTRPRRSRDAQANALPGLARRCDRAPEEAAPPGAAPPAVWLADGRRPTADRQPAPEQASQRASERGAAGLTRGVRTHTHTLAPCPAAASALGAAWPASHRLSTADRLAGWLSCAAQRHACPARALLAYVSHRVRAARRPEKSTTPARAHCHCHCQGPPAGPNPASQRQPTLIMARSSAAVTPLR